MCVSTGVTPATDFLKDSGLSITERGFVTVDKVSASIDRQHRNRSCALVL